MNAGSRLISSKIGDKQQSHVKGLVIIPLQRNPITAEEYSENCLSFFRGVSFQTRTYRGELLSGVEVLPSVAARYDPATSSSGSSSRRGPEIAEELGTPGEEYDPRNAQRAQPAHHAQTRGDMKLSVSAYRAQASAHKKILCSYQHQLSYGATSHGTGGRRTPSDPAAGLPQFKVRIIASLSKPRS